MGSADTGARAREAALKRALEKLRYIGYGDGDFRPLNALEAQQLLALAAGVGVPPGEARWLWFCSECGACEGDTMQPGCCRSCGSSAEGVRLKARFASDALAGVGEARPAEPPQSVESLLDADDLAVIALTKERDMHDAMADSFADRAETAEAEVRQLREQLDAGERDNTRLLNEAVEAEDRVSVLVFTLEEIVAHARAALGVVGPPPDQGAESAESADVRGGES